MKLGLLCSVTGIVAIYVGAFQSSPDLVPIARISEEHVGLQMIISGQVIDLRSHEDGHLFLKVLDESGATISVPIFSRVRSGLDKQIELLDNVRVLGRVELYNGELEIVPESARDVRVTTTPCANLSEICEDRLGDLVKVQGEICERRIVGAGNLLLILQEGDAELPVFVPVSVVRKDGFPELHTGYTVRAGGQLQLYKGVLELKIRDPAHLRVVRCS